MISKNTIRHALGGVRRLSAHLAGRGRWPVALGALLLMASTASVVATTNSPPGIGRLRLSDDTPYEGETVTLLGVYGDPDPGDRHTMIIYWHGADTEEDQKFKQKIQLPADRRPFEVTHVYTNEMPTKPIKVIIFDHDLPDGANDNTGGMRSAYEIIPIKVLNVAPQIVENSIKIEKKGKTQVVVEGDFTDPGVADKMEAFATWSDPATPRATSCTLSNGDRHFRCEHTYTHFVGLGISRTYDVNLIVQDDGGGADQYQIKVRFP